MLDSIWIKITSSFMGADEHGNRYFESKSKDYLGRRRRYVLYKDRAEPSSVPPALHAWLHYLTNDFLDENTHYAWQKPHASNATGTKMAYDPLDHKIRGKVSADHVSWSPK